MLDKVIDFTLVETEGNDMKEFGNPVLGLIRCYIHYFLSLAQKRWCLMYDISV